MYSGVDEIATYKMCKKCNYGCDRQSAVGGNTCFDVRTVILCLRGVGCYGADSACNLKVRPEGRVVSALNNVLHHENVLGGATPRVRPRGNLQAVCSVQHVCVPGNFVEAQSV